MDSVCLFMRPLNTGKNDGISGYETALCSELESKYSKRFIFRTSEMKKISATGNIFYAHTYIPPADIVHGLSNITPVFYQGNRIVTAHDVIPLAHPEWFTLGHALQWKFFFPQMFRKMNAILADSESTRNDVIRFCNVSPQKVRVIPQAINHRVFRKLINRTVLELVRKKYNLPERFILNVNTVEPRKNVVRLVDSFVSLIKRDVNECLVIVGRRGWGNAIQEIEKKIVRENLSQRIKILGYVDPQDLPAIYNLAEVFVFPSLYEGFGIPPLEAMACGTPVIASNTSSLPEVIGDAGFLVNPNKPDEIADKIIEIVKSNRLQRELSKKGLKRAKMFTWKKTTKQTLEVYEELLKK